MNGDPNCHCEASAHTGCGNLVQELPNLYKFVVCTVCRFADGGHMCPPFNRLSRTLHFFCSPTLADRVKNARVRAVNSASTDADRATMTKS